MAFKYDLSEGLEKALSGLCRRDKRRYEATWKKIREITARSADSIDFYKNLSYGLKEYKRCHIDRSFVLLFRVFKAENYIFFDKLGHHDDIFKR